MISKKKYGLNIVCVSILFCSVFNSLNAQEKKDSIKMQNESDSMYIKKYSRSIGLTTTWSLRNFEFILGYPKLFNIKISPNNIQQLNFDIDYKFLSFNYSYTAPFLNNTNPYKGSSSRKSYGLSLNLNKVNVRLDYARTQGFYMVNTSDFDATWTAGKPFIQFPDLINEQTGLSIAYNLNKKYSLAALTSGNELQSKTTFSFIPCLYAYYFRLHENIIDSNSLSQDKDYLRDFDLNLVLPIAATFVLNKNLYVSAIAGPSIGLDVYKANNVTLTSRAGYSTTVVSTGYLLRGGLGYTGDRWYCGAEGILRRYSNKNSAEEKIIKIFYGVQLYVGVRIEPPGFIKKGVRWIQKNSPIKL